MSNPPANILRMALRLPVDQTWLTGSCAALAVVFGLLAGVDPKLAIAASLGVAFTLVALANLTVGLAVFTFLGFVVVVPNFFGETLSVVKVAALPLLLSWLATVSRSEDGRSTLVGVHPMLSMAMVALIAWAAISYSWAESPPAALSSVFRFGLAAILVFIVYTAVRSERDVRMIVTAMVLGTVAAAAYGFLAPSEADFGQLERLGGTLGNPNELAAALVVGIALSGGLAASTTNAVARASAIAAIGLCLLAILLTGSRGGLVALATMLVAAIFLARGRRLALVLVTLVAILATVGYIVSTAPQQSKERFLNPGSGTGRTDIWTIGGRMVAANPVIGVGAGNFTTSSIHYLLRPGALENSEYIADSPTVAQNMYLEVLAELGVPGVTLFLSIIVICLACMLAALSKFRALGRHRLAPLAVAIPAALLGLLASDIFTSAQYSRNLWLLLGLGPALLAIATQSEHSETN